MSVAALLNEPSVWRQSQPPLSLLSAAGALGPASAAEPDELPPLDVDPPELLLAMPPDEDDEVDPPSAPASTTTFVTDCVSVVEALVV